MSESGKQALLLVAIVVCLVLVVQPNALAALAKRPEAPRRVLSEAEMQLFTTTANSGEIVMVGANGVLIDQGSQSLRVGTSHITAITNSQERLRIDSSGNVGIGTTNPASTLHVRGGMALFRGSETLASEAGSRDYLCELGTSNSSISGGLRIYANRAATGSDWTTTSISMTYWVDVTQFATLSFYQSSMWYTGNMVISRTGEDSFPSFNLRSDQTAKQVSIVSITKAGSGVNGSLVGDGLILAEQTPGDGSKIHIGRRSNYNATLSIVNSGNVGIGTTNPEAALHVLGFTGYSTPGTIARFRSNISQSGNKDVGLDFQINNNDATGGTSSGSYAAIQSLMDNVAYTPLILNPTAGNVGIGKTNPDCRLDVVGLGAGTISDWISASFGIGTTTAPRVVIGSYSDQAIIGAHNPNLSDWSTLYLNPAGNTIIGSVSGNVGIGTNNPLEKLHVFQSNLLVGNRAGEGGMHSISIEGNGDYGMSYLKFQAGDYTQHYQGHASRLSAYGIMTYQAGEHKFIDGHMSIKTDFSESTSQIYLTNTYGGNTLSCFLFQNSSNRTVDGGGLTATLRNDAGNLRLQASGGYDNAKGITIQADTGNVGIGTVSPWAKLHVQDTSPTIVTNSSGTKNANDMIGQLVFYDSGNGGAVIRCSKEEAGANNNSYLSFHTSLDYSNIHREAMRITRYGAVGIGTNAPEQLLDVRGGGQFATAPGAMYSTDAFTGQTLPNWMFRVVPTGSAYNGDGNAICQAGSISLKAQTLEWNNMVLPGAELIVEGGKSNRAGETRSSMIFKTSGAEIMRINGYGQVGIGTTAPLTDCRFQVCGYNDGISSTSWIAGCFGAKSDSTAPRVVMGAYSNMAIVGAHNSTLSEWAPLCLNPGGNVGIGITDPNQIYRPLVVQHASQPWEVPGTYFESGSNGSPSGLIWTNYGVPNVAIVAFGAIVSTTYIGVNSDQRIKKDIKQLSYSLEDLMKIQPVEYFFKDTIKNNGQKQVGFIAQQVKAVIPEVVSIDEGTIPDAFQVTPILDRSGDKILVRLPEGLDWQEGETIKLISETDGDIEACKVVEIIGDLCWIHVKEKWEGLGERVFLYGKRTKDLHNIDYGKLTPLLVKSIQEQQLMISEQSRTISEQSRTIQDLTARLSLVESLLAQLVR